MIIKVKEKRVHEWGPCADFQLGLQRRKDSQVATKASGRKSSQTLIVWDIHLYLNIPCVINDNLTSQIADIKFYFAWVKLSFKSPSGPRFFFL